MRAQLDRSLEPLAARSSVAAPRSAAQSSVGISVRHYVAGGRERGGGIGRMVGYIADSAAEAGHDHIVTDTRGPRWFPPTSMARLLAAIMLMARDRVVAPARVHHIHVAGRGSTTRKRILAAMARALGCIHVVHLHDFDYAADFRARSPRQQALIRPMFQQADHVVALGQRDHETLATLLEVDPGRIAILHNGVPDPGEHEKRGRATPNILFLGRLSERKGVPELLQALASPVMAALPWHAVLAGDGPVADYRQQAAALGLADRVDMPGWLGPEETRTLCAQADILTLPSHAEGMAMAVIEGLAHGLAIVTTRVGAHEEAISDGQSGLFVPAGDVDALAHALARLIKEPETRTRLSAAARARYIAGFSMASYRRSLERLYEAVLHRHK